MIYTLSKTDKKNPGTTEVIFFDETNYKGNAYIAYIGFEVDFGKGLTAAPDQLNDKLKSVKTGNLCKVVLYEDYGLTGLDVSVPADSGVVEIPLALTSFKVELDQDGKIIDKLTQAEFEKIQAEDGLEKCSLEKKEQKDKLNNYEKSLEELRNKLAECDKKSEDLTKDLNNKILEKEVKDINDKLGECEKKGKELEDQLSQSEQEKNDIKKKLEEYEKVGD